MRHSTFRLILSLIILLILAAPILILQARSQGTRVAPQTTSVEYVRSSALFPNPERGFYYHTEAHSNDYTPLDLPTLQGYRQNEQITLILRVFYLEEFVTSDISPTYLDAMQADFDTVRAAGVKLIVRFAYTDQLPPTPPYGDASKAQILRHLEQVQPILQANRDVIAVVQAGFVGVWGEWYFTDHFVQDPNNPDEVTEADWANRREVVSEILRVLPTTRMVQARTPFIKQNIINRALPITPTEAYNRSDVARIGHHNDCFLASETDFGTYRSEVMEEEKAYLAEETRYLPMGGETCAPNPPRSDCPTAIEELSRFHWSYLNSGYHPDVLSSWETTCLQEIKRRLGHRLALVRGTYPDAVQPGGAFTVDIELQNDGWAAPFNPRLVELVLRNSTSGNLYRVQLPDDPRAWLPERGTISLTHTICTATSLPPGQYALLLNLADPEPSLSSLPAYAIRLANEAVWEENAGYNNLLHTITVQGATINPASPRSTMLEGCKENTFLPLTLSP